MIVTIWINCPSEEVADTIARSLLEQCLIGAANRHPAIESRYRWKGRLETAREVPLLLKTRRDLFDDVVAAVRKLHPYETPAILAVPVEAANPEYLDWMATVTIANRR